MDETERASRLIGEIYDASLDPALWTSALRQTCEYVEGCAASLMSQELTRPSGQFYFSWGDDPHFTRLYFERYLRINPLFVPTLMEAQAGGVFSVLDLVSQEEYFASRFYKEWARPQGYFDAVHAVLDKSATGYASVAVARHERHGRVDSDVLRRMGALAPHFRRAVSISKIIELHKVEASALSDTLDGVAAAMFLVNATARIVHANLSGHALLGKGEIVRTANGNLRASDAHADQALRDVFAAASGGDVDVGVKGIAIPLAANDGEQWVAHVLPLTSGARRRAGASYSAVAAVFIRKADLDLPSPIEALAKAHSLTPAEIRVLFAIAQVGGVREAAEVLGIAQPTVRTHLQHVFDKTGTSRQAELIKLVAGFAGPFGASPLR